MTENVNAADTAQSNRDAMLNHTASIVAAFVRNNSVQTGDVAGLIRQTYESLSGLNAPAAPEAVHQEPAVTIKQSVKPDFLICLEGGEKVKMLRRMLMRKYNMTFEQYKAKWGLPADYPSVAPNYSERRRELAKEIGLGTKGGRGRGKAVEASVTEEDIDAAAVVETEIEKTAPKAKAPAKAKVKSAAQAKKDAQAHLSGKTAEKTDDKAEAETAE